MSAILFIAEKPSLARAIAEGLGVLRRGKTAIECRNGAVVTWCFGHLLEQAEPDAYLPDHLPKTKKGAKIWRLEDLPIFPKTWQMLVKKEKGARAQLAAIGKLIREADVVVNAGDPDREGQLLVDEVLEHFRCRKPVKRFWVSAIDPASVKRGLSRLTENSRYAGMRDAARGRARADWLLGMNLSRAYTLTNRSAGGRSELIAVGRVQTPTLTMVARRDYAVEHFVPKDYFAVSARLSAQGAAFRARWKPRPGQPGMDEEGKLLLDLKLGEALVARLSQEKTATVVAAATKRKKAYPPKAYSLADIQVEANRLYGFTAEETLKICQSLYEKHKITSYPRTDCCYLPESQHAEAPRVLAAIAETLPAAAKAVSRADPSLKSPTFNDRKVTAHHGIVPVGNAAAWSSLTEREQKLYRLIAKRYIAQFFVPHEYDETVIDFEIGGEIFTAKGRTVVVKGWKALLTPAESRSDAKKRTGENSNDPNAADAADADQALPKLARGDTAEVLAVEGRADKTKPPAYYTEGTLIAAMENIWRAFDDPHLQEKLKEAGGIGTPATRAAIIQELKRKAYLAADGKKLHCTELGRRVLRKASPKVRSAAMTAAFEAKLQLVEKGEYALEAFVAEYEAFIRSEIDGLLAGGEAPAAARSPGASDAPDALDALDAPKRPQQ